MEGVTAGLRDSGSCEHCSRQCRSAHAAVPAPAGHADLQAKGDNGISSKPFFRQERAETLRLVQTSKVWGSSGAACKTHAPTSSTCPPALLPEAELWSWASKQKLGWKDSSRYRTNLALGEPLLSLLLSLFSLFRLEHDHCFQKPALISLGCYDSSLNNRAKS